MSNIILILERSKNKTKLEAEMATRIVYDFERMNQKCKEMGLNVSSARLSDYILHGLPIKKDINNVADLALREETIAFAEGFIRAINKAGYGKYIKEKINYEEVR